MGGAAGFGEQRMGQVCSLLSHASGPEGPIPKALYLGLGTGSTMGGALAVPHAAAEGVELVPEIVELLPHFADINHDLAKRPEVTLHAADARRYLAAAPGSYDLVVADLFHPGQAGASSLFAREHFAAARDHLRPGGLMCQWLPLYQLDEADVRTIVRTFLDEFPESYAFLGIYNAQNPALALVGRAPDPSAGQLHLDVARLQADTAKLQNIVDPRDLLASYVMGPGELAAWAGDGPRNTDLAPEIAFQAARVAYRDDRTLGAHNLGVILGRAVAAPAALLTGSGAEALAAASAPFTAAARHYLAGEIARGDTADLSSMSWETAEHFVRAYEADPAFAPARGALYTIARKNQALAAKLLPRMLARTPDEPRVYEAYLLHLRAAGDQAAYQQLRAEATAKFPGATLP
ncbi:spermidine synthase [Nannocystis pusilla]|uniref:spermidine synthase n=1 Tax=Nannocystis pusilla TaxID=889268 RepID=UPI003B82313C